MPAPKGMRAMTFSVNSTDAVHVYSDAQHIWLQLRRAIPTQDDISAPSFKTAIRLTRDQAISIAGELLTASTHHKSSPPTAKPLQSNGTTPSTPANHGKPWTPAEDKKLADAFDAQTTIPQLAKAHKRGVGGIQSRLTKLGKLTADQYKTYPPESQ